MHRPLPRCPPPRSLEQLEGLPCYGGLAIGATRDLTSLTLAWPDDDGFLDSQPDEGLEYC